MPEIAEQPTVEVPEEPMVKVKIVRSASQGLTLEIDAAKFHRYLDSIGVPKSTMVYLDPPYQEYSGAINRYEHRIQPAALLQVQNPKSYRLNEVYNGGLTFEQLVELTSSIKEVYKATIEHYRPVEIEVRLIEKK